MYSRAEAEKLVEDISKECQQELSSLKRMDPCSLVKRILGDPVHLLSEMLQNADDAEATEMQILFSQEAITFQDNGKGFEKEEVDAICKIGISSKKTLGYIGMYGIGFKSVFAVTDNPEVYSGKFSFSFDHKTVYVPQWINEPKPKFFDWRTSINLPFKNKKAYEATQRCMSLLLKEDMAKVLVYLRHLKKIHIHEEDSETIYECGNVKKHDLERIGLQSLVLKENGKPAKYICLYQTLEEIPNELLKHIIEERQLNVEPKEIKGSKATISLCFETDEKGHILHSEEGRLIAFLPTKVKTFLPFDINADFLLSPNREELNRVDDVYNVWLLDKVGKAIKSILSNFKEHAPESFCADIYKLVPWEKIEREAYIEQAIVKPVLEYVREGSFFLTSDSRKSWAFSTEVVDPDGKFKRLFHQPSEVEEGNLYYLSAEIEGEVKSKLISTFDIKKWDIDTLVDEILPKANFITGKEPDWLLKLFEYIGESYRKSDGHEQKQFISKLERCYLIPCEGGETIRLSDRKLVYRSTRKLPDFIPKEKVYQLRQDFYGILTKEIKPDDKQSRVQEYAREWLWDLVPDATPSRIYEDIICPQFVKVGDNEVDQELCKVLDHYVLYLKQNDVEADGIKLRVKGRRTYRDAKGLCMSNDYLEYEIEPLMGPCDVEFVTPDYLALEPDSQGAQSVTGWKRFLKQVGVQYIIDIEEKRKFGSSSKEEFIKELESHFGQRVTWQLKGSGKPYRGYSPEYERMIGWHAYRLIDRSFKSNFLSVLNNNLKNSNLEFFKQLLKMLDTNWDEFKDRTKLYYYYTDMRYSRQIVEEERIPSLSSEFGRWLLEQKWLPVHRYPNGEAILVKPSEVYLLSSNTAGIESALYIEQDEIRNPEFREFLSIKMERPREPIKPPTASEETLDDLLKGYQRMYESNSQITKEVETFICKLYKRIASEPNNAPLEKIQTSMKKVIAASDTWENLSDVRYYVSESKILDSLCMEVRREIIWLPSSLNVRNIKDFFSLINLRDICHDTHRRLDKSTHEDKDVNYFIYLGNALASLVTPKEGNDTSETLERRVQVSKIRCRKTSCLRYLLVKNGKEISDWVEAEGILQDNIFWFKGELEDLGIEVARELTNSNFINEENRDFVEKIFARSENWIRKVLKEYRKEYQEFTPIPKTPERPPGPPGVRTETGGERLEKKRLQKIKEYEEKRGQEAEIVAYERPSKGYDIESLGINERRFIEVKGSTEVVLTDNEKRKAEEHGEEYWLYIVLSDEPFKFKIIQNPHENCNFEEKRHIQFHIQFKVTDWMEKGHVVEYEL